MTQNDIVSNAVERAPRQRVVEVSKGLLLPMLLAYIKRKSEMLKLKEEDQVYG
jgi:hypothetical protein